jgi:hypothetical protein
MHQSETANESPAMKQVQQQFEYWRRTRKKRCAIPGKLWRAAESLYPEHSLYHISKALRLNYLDLKGRIDGKQIDSIPSTINAAEFIELKLDSPMQPSECFVEMEDSFGAKMRMHFKGGAGLDLLELGRMFWSRHP